MSYAKVLMVWQRFSVSSDGTWQKRGSVSMNGTVAIISIDNGKIIDIEKEPCHRNKGNLSGKDFNHMVRNSQGIMFH